jgi:hypothetical protein
MGAVSVTGHAVNVANFKTLTTTCTYFGGKYNPVNAAIKLPGLNAVIAAADAAMNDLKNALPAYEKAISLRATAFEPISALVTRRWLTECAGGARGLAATAAAARRRRLDCSRSHAWPCRCHNADHYRKAVGCRRISGGRCAGGHRRRRAQPSEVIA